MTSPTLKRITISIPDSTAEDLKALRQQHREDGIILSEADILRHAVRIHIKRSLRIPNADRRQGKSRSTGMQRTARRTEREAAQLAFQFGIDRGRNR